MSQFGGGAAKNPPWVRQGQSMGVGMGVSAQQNQMQAQQMMSPMNNTAMLQYPQAQMYQQLQSGMAMQTMGLGTNQMPPTGAGMASASLQSSSSLQNQPQMYSQVGTVSYPTRALIATPFGSGQPAQPAGVPPGGSTSGSNASPKQRVFTGTVTKVQDNFGFVDEEVFFQTSCCVKGSNPQVGDKVLVEAMYNASMPFKWNATRIQVLPMDRSSDNMGGNRSRFNANSYNSVPPPTENILNRATDFNRNDDFDRGGFGQRRNNNNKRNRRNNDDMDRKRRREDRRSIETRDEKDKEKEKEKEKERPRSPPSRKRSKTPRRRKAKVVPRYTVQIPKIALDMPEADVLELKKRYTNLYIPSDFFVSTFKWVEVFPPHRPLNLERPCAFHVMHKDVDPVIENDAVLDPPDADYLFCAKVMLLSMPELDEIYQKCCAPADEKEGSQDDYEKDFVHPTRLINFLVGLRGKNETMAIGGPWSPSLDGSNPEKDPSVLIKTATRCCKALTGVDLSNCSRWYRFVEIYYHRAESVHKGKTVPARVETVVFYLPDVWNCQPTRLEWDGLHLNYKKQLDRLLNQDEEPEGDDKEVNATEVQKREPTHYAQLDPKVMKVHELREELEARNLSSKGLKSQLTARLMKILKTEQEKEEEEKAAKEGAPPKTEKEEKDEEKKKKEEEEKKKLDEKERQLTEKRHTLPEKSHILVHPSRVAKSGKFDCTVMSLSLLLDYRPEDSKEHSFEVSLFAELFNEMLMRDFGFCIYKALTAAPEKPKEEKDDKDKKDKDKKLDKDKKNGDEKKDDKKEEKKDDKISIEEDDDGSDDDKKDPGKKKKANVKLVTVDPYLLLSFVYFDQSHCGYIFDKDVEELLFTLGLNLSRAQVKKLVQKVVARDSLLYRKLTDKPKDEPSVKPDEDLPIEELINLGYGNKRLFPIFEEDGSASKRNRKSGSEKKQDNQQLSSGLVMYNGSLLDIGKLNAQFQRSEESRLKTEKTLEKLRSEHSNLKESNNRNTSTVKKLTFELRDFKERLANTNSELCNMDGKTKMYLSVMADIYDKLTPIVAKQIVKEECIEDVEMEDVMESECKRVIELKKDSSQTTVKPELQMKEESTGNSPSKPTCKNTQGKLEVTKISEQDQDKSASDASKTNNTDTPIVSKQMEKKEVTGDVETKGAIEGENKLVEEVNKDNSPSVGKPEHDLKKSEKSKTDDVASQETNPNANKSSVESPQGESPNDKITRVTRSPRTVVKK